MDIKTKLINLRKEHGYSQDQVAEKLGISRQTYNKLENNDDLITKKQLDHITELYGIQYEELFYGIQNVKKFKQMYLYILSKFDENGVTKTKLAKLLYLADFRHFYETLESMSGVLYKCKEYGPLADPFLEITDEMFDNGEIQIDSLSRGAQMIKLSTKLFDDSFNLLSPDEKQEMDEICELWKDVNTQTIVNYTHHQKPWMACRENEVIPYTLILQEDPDNVYTPIA